MVGGEILLSYNELWHVAVIEGFTANGILVVEGNYIPCLVTRREIAFNDPRIVAFFFF